MSGQEAHRSCPVRGCQARFGRGLLMCREHWHMVPRALQRQVNTTWRALVRSLGEQSSTEEMLKATRAYRAEADAAVAAVEKALP